ncbi:MAG: outer membrane lipoprotein-sorting protein [Cellvibrionales bacterium]|nr:outer membrane lipoprotein-sorting protein [Cellvibrionales bacterium]
MLFTVRLFALFGVAVALSAGAESPAEAGPSEAGLAAEPRDGRAVMAAVREQSRIHPDQRAAVDLIIRNAKGEERVRRFRLLHKALPEHSKSLVKFFRPASISGTALLSESRDLEEKTLQWIYLPALRDFRQLSTEARHDSFMGSDFSNADIAGRRLDQDTHRIIKEDENYIYIESTPKDSADPYSRMEIKIGRAIQVPVKIDFYDRTGQLLKTLENKKIARVKGMYTPVEAQMANILSGGATIMRKSDIRVDRPIADTEVGFKGLRK